MSVIFARSNLAKVCKYTLAYKFHTSSALQAIKDYYDVLRLPKTANQAEIKDAYYKLSKIYHPDVKSDESSLNMFRAITEAYDVLGNVTARDDYDKEKFSTKELVDTSKSSFFVSLQKEHLKYGAVGTPDYEKIFTKLSKRDSYLRDEERDRHMEIGMDQRKLYENQLEAFGDYGAQRSFIVIALAWGMKMTWMICEDYFGWGLPDDYEEDWEYAPH